MEFGKNEKKLNELKNELKEIEVIAMDLSNSENCKKLYEKVKNEDIDILINNAGFGDFGEFTKTDLEKEISMINTNITAVHVLTKLFLKDMVKKDKGYILNVASIAGFMPGPLMATYYSTKSYIVRLSESIYTELKKKKSNVTISVLCPGPVATNFNNVAGVKFNLKSMSSEYVAKIAIKEMFRKKLLIFPGVKIKLARILAKISSEKLVGGICYYMQERKTKNR